MISDSRRRWGPVLVAAGALFFSMVPAVSVQAGAPGTPKVTATPVVATSVAFDVSPRLVDLPPAPAAPAEVTGDVIEVRPDSGPSVADNGFSGDAAVPMAASMAAAAEAIGAPVANFEGLSNQDNFNIFGFRVNPPDPMGDVGPNHYVELINLVGAVYSKAGDLLAGPFAIGSLWDGFAIDDCTDPSGDPVVLYDQLSDRWLLSQFTTRGPTYYNCVAISQTADPTGAYYRYAFPSGEFFPDYPKYGVWSNSYVLTTRDFGPEDDNGNFDYGISVYALERNKMVNGEPTVGVVQFFLDSAIVPLNLIGDGLLPPDIDGTRRPLDGAPAPILGTQDDDYPYGAESDAINVWELAVKWNSGKKGPVASLALKAQLPVAEFDSNFPCAPTARDCLPQPGITNPEQYLDILSYRQRPTWRLAYRNTGAYETMVTNQSVEAAPGMAGVRWYEIRRTGGTYALYQQGTFAPADGVHRWMGSAAMDKFGGIALGYSVVNGTDVFPGIRYTGRLASDPLGQMTLGEGVIMNGSGVQRTLNSRWGDYTSLNVDPVDDCTFWYVNEYYTAEGQASSTAGWQTRIASFRLPGC